MNLKIIRKILSMQWDDEMADNTIQQLETNHIRFFEESQTLLTNDIETIEHNKFFQLGMLFGIIISYCSDTMVEKDIEQRTKKMRIDK